MRKIIALLMAAAFTFTLGVAFAQEKTQTSAPEKKEEKAPAKKKHVRKHAKKKAAKKEGAAAPAAPATK